jgi:hypothetical protein
MTYKELIGTMNTLANNIDNQDTKVQKKLFKIHSKLKSEYDKYVDLMNDLRLDNAEVDEKGHLIVNEKGEYKFSKESTKKLQAAAKELLEKEFPFDAIEVINPAGLEIHTYLKGWVKGVNFVDVEDDADIL